MKHSAPKKAKFFFSFKRFLARLGMTSAGMILLVVLIALFWLRTFGLPSSIKRSILDELARVGLVVDAGKLLLDPRGAVLAEDVTVYRAPDKGEIWLHVDSSRIGLAWFSWWRGRPFLESASVENAIIRLPLSRAMGIDESADPRLELTQVNASVELQKGVVKIRSGQARLFGFEIFLTGRIRLERPPPRLPLTPEEKAQRERLLRQWTAAVSQIRSQEPIRIEAVLDVSTREPALAQGRFDFAGRNIVWRGVPIRQVAMSGGFDKGVFTLQESRLQLARGELALRGQLDTVTQSSQWQVDSNLDFTPFASAFEGWPKQLLQRLKFGALPRLQGRCKFDWKDQPRVEAQADVDWEDFQLGKTKFDRLKIPLAYDGRRLLVVDARLQNAGGKLEAEFFYEKDKPRWRARLDSTLDPTSFQGIFDENADRFLQSCRFDKGGPAVRAELSGKSGALEDVQASGRIQTGNFSYKGVAFEAGRSNFNLKELKLSLPNLWVKRPEGTASGGVVYDFKEHMVQISKVDSRLDVTAVAPVLGAKFTQYVAPYRFNRAPRLRVNGVADVRPGKIVPKHNLAIDVDGTGAQMQWELFRAPLTFVQPKGHLQFLGRQTTLELEPTELMGGKIEGRLKLVFEEETQYQTRFELLNVDFSQLMKSFFRYEGSRGTLTGEAELGGLLGKLETMQGGGRAAITDGYLMKIPIFGGLTPLLSGVIPDFGMSKADKANATFALKDGRVETRDLEISSSTFALIGQGSYDYLKDDLDMDMRVNVRGLPGLLLYGVSKLFEYEGRGPMRGPKWTSKNFGFLDPRQDNQDKGEGSACFESAFVLN